MKFFFTISLGLFMSTTISFAQQNQADTSILFKPCIEPLAYAVDDLLLKEAVGELKNPGKNPSFKDGPEAVINYFAANPLTDPKAKNMVFRIHIAFTVNCEGQFGDLKIISKGKGDLEIFAQQVLAIAQKMPQSWQPAKAGGKSVDSYQILSFTVIGGALNKVSYR